MPVHHQAMAEERPSRRAASPRAIARTGPARTPAPRRCRARRGRRGGWRRARARAAARAASARAPGSRSPPPPRAPCSRPTRTRPSNRPTRVRQDDVPSSGAQLGEALLDSLVRVAEPLLEPQHLLADDREAEMPGLDDAGVHRADRDLVDAVAGDANEGIVDRRSRRRRRGVGTLVSRAESDLPARCRGRARAACRAAPIGDDPEQVGRGALHPLGAREVRRQVGIRRRIDRQRAGRARPGLRRARRRPRPRSLRLAASRGRRPRARPGGRRRAATARAAASHASASTHAAPDRQRRRQAFERELQSRDAHRLSLRSSVPPGCTSRPGKAGRTGPASGRARDGRTPAAAPADAPAACTLVSPNTIGSTRPKTDANATPSASSRNGVAQGCSRIAVVRIRNSLAKTPNGGMPRIASDPSISPQPTVGLTLIRPRISLHHLGARLLRRVADGKEDRRLGQRVHRHVQQAGEVGDRTAQAERERDQPHVLDRRVGEHALDVLLARQEERRDHHRDQAEAHHQVCRRARCAARRRSAPCSAGRAYSATLSSRPDSTAETGVGPSACASGSQLCSGTSPTLVP